VSLGPVQRRVLEDWMHSKAISSGARFAQSRTAGASRNLLRQGATGGRRRGPHRKQQGGEDILRVRGALRRRDRRHKGIVGAREGSVARSGDVPKGMTAPPSVANALDDPEAQVGRRQVPFLAMGLLGRGCALPRGVEIFLFPTG
jgi:hypothetical protein